MKKTIIEFWAPRNRTVTTDSGFRYLDVASEFKSQTEKEYSDDIKLFEEFYKMNNRLRYCNGSYHKFQDKEVEAAYKKWLQSDDFKRKSFDLYYGGGVVD